MFAPIFTTVELDIYVKILYFLMSVVVMIITGESVRKGKTIRVKIIGR